jgi:hypothetical protein
MKFVIHFRGYENAERTTEIGGLNEVQVIRRFKAMFGDVEIIKIEKI